MTEAAGAREALESWFGKQTLRDRPPGTAAAVRAELARQREDRARRLARERARAADVDGTEELRELARARRARAAQGSDLIPPHPRAARCVCAACEAVRVRLLALDAPPAPG